MNNAFGKYELIERVGMGGMAEVFRARTFGAEGFVKDLCIKRILPTFSEDPDFVQMFINEAQLAASLHHANIVQIYDFDVIDEMYYIVMEFIDGPDIRRIHNTARKRNIKIPETFTIHTAVEALKGLHYAHTKIHNGKPLKLIHRDISPHNLLVSYSGEIKLTDFGIAKAAVQASVTRTGAIKGKLAYMSPEQARGDLIDQRTDLFGLGVVLWELLTGKRLYRDIRDEGDLLKRVQRGTIPSVHDLNPDASEQLVVFVSRLTSRNPDERFNSAADALKNMSHLAAASGTLEVSEFLLQLMPETAEKYKQGNTKYIVSAGNQPVYNRSAAQAETQTHGADHTLPIASQTSDANIASDKTVTGPPISNSIASNQTKSSKDLLTNKSEQYQSKSVRNRFEEDTGNKRKTQTTLRLQARELVQKRAPVLLACTFVLLLFLGLWAIVPLGKTASNNQNTPKSSVVEKNNKGEVLGKTIGVGDRHQIQTQNRVVETSVPSNESTQLVEVSKIQDPIIESTDSKKANVAALKKPSPDLTSTNASVQKDKKTKARKRKTRKISSKRFSKSGLINIYVYPWALVKLDGVLLKQQTPIKGLKVAEGKHFLELLNDPLKRKERLSVVVSSKAAVTIRRRWTP